MSKALHTNFPVENDDNIMLESSLPLMIIVLSIAEVTQITGAICSLNREQKKKKKIRTGKFITCNCSEYAERERAR